MAQSELTGARSVLDIERGRWDIRSIKMFRLETGEDVVVFARRGNVKNLPRKSKRARRYCPVLLPDLENPLRGVSGCRKVLLPDVRHASQIWNYFFQEFHVLG